MADCCHQRQHAYDVEFRWHAEAGSILGHQRGLLQHVDALEVVKCSLLTNSAACARLRPSSASGLEPIVSCLHQLPVPSALA